MPIERLPDEIELAMGEEQEVGAASAGQTVTQYFYFNGRPIDMLDGGFVATQPGQQPFQFHFGSTGSCGFMRQSVGVIQFRHVKREPLF